MSQLKFDIKETTETFVEPTPTLKGLRGNPGFCTRGHWSLLARPYHFTLKKQFSTQGSFPAFGLFPPDRTHLSFISPFAIAPVLLDFCGVASGGQ